jgi:hypothetical protein
MSQRNTPFNYTGEHLSEEGKKEYEFTGVIPLTNAVASDKANISTTEQVFEREKQVINGMEFVSVKGQLWRYYDVPTGSGGSTVRVKIENPEWLYVRPSGAHTVIDAEGQVHYVPNKFVRILWKNAKGEPLARF